MRRSMLKLMVLFAPLAVTPAVANDVVELSAKARTQAVAAAVTPSKLAEAPFSAGRDPLPELLLREEQERRSPRPGCDSAGTSLCYDLADGRIVYRPARNYMPKFDGMRAESISLRHDKVVFKYSFR